MMRYGVLVIALAVVIGGCATAGAPETPVAITDVNQLAGHWTGWVFRPQVSGSVVTTIRPDGTFTASSNSPGITDVYGNISVRDGKARYETTLSQQGGVVVTPSGTVQLFDGGGKRILRGQSDDGMVKFNASQVQ
ncbi:MAG: hypothetical protein DMD91_05430 [Candidatus Rokuibacteriota bacterium]|nr:MAG: hypothetical protein DMD91_05430 [Candidatus Rokubacteria bacterium]